MPSEREFYKQRGFARRVGVGTKPCLLIIDFINAFTNETSPLGANLDKEIENTRIVLDYFREKHLPVHFTTTEYDDCLLDAGVFIKKVPSLENLKKGTPLVEIDSRIIPLDEEMIWVKHYASAFFGTSLSSTLIVQRIDTVFIAGCTTSGCVRATAVDACQHGFHTIVLRDCVGDRSLSAHESNLFDLDAKYADVIGYEEALKILKTINY
ncbi:MAG TPA: isochorismatase family protein [Candidatus Nitrosotenuis sp.]|nr:isochorismatase family protein [Candidatus Nitrosotenuis sp.]